MIELVVSRGNQKRWKHLLINMERSYLLPCSEKVTPFIIFTFYYFCAYYIILLRTSVNSSVKMNTMMDKCLQKPILGNILGALLKN